MASSLVLIAEFQAKPAHEDQLRQALEDMIGPSLAEEGCFGYRPLSDPAKQGLMLCLEEWADEAALQYHFTTPHFRHVADVLDEALAAPFTLTRLTRVPDSGA